MRLIDVDDLHVYVIGGRRNGKITAKTLVEEALERIFREAPTVEAIPIEWINEYANKHRIYSHAFAEMLVEWAEREEVEE